MVTSWIDQCSSHVEVLPCSREDGKSALCALQVTTRSTLGALALECGGILVDHGWLRLLGAGHPGCWGNLLDFNGLGETLLDGAEPVCGAFIVAYDVLGGMFAINSGGLGANTGNVFYFAVDTLQWEDLAVSHTAFVHWCFQERLTGFYGEDRWPGFVDDLKALAVDRGFHFVPPLWAQSDFQPRSRKDVPLKELFAVNRSYLKQLSRLD